MNLLSLLCSYLPGYKWREVEELHEAETEVDGKSSTATFPRLRANHCYPVDQSRRQAWKLHQRIEHRRFLTLVASLQHQISPSYDVAQAQMQIEDEETVIIAAISCPVGCSGQLHDTEPIPVQLAPLLERLNRIKHAENMKKIEESKRGYLYANDLEKV